MPAPITYAHAHHAAGPPRCARTAPSPSCGPTASARCRCQYVNGKPERVSTVVLSHQHSEEVTYKELKEALIETVIRKAIPAELLDGQGDLPHQPHRALRHRRPARRHRPHRAQDHRGHLRRHGAARRRRLLRQGPHARWTARRPTWRATSPRTSWPRAVRALRGAGGLRHRRARSPCLYRLHLRHRQGPRREDREGRDPRSSTARPAGSSPRSTC